MNYENYDPCFPDQPVVDLYLPIWAKLPAFASKPAFIWTENGPSGQLNGSGLTYAELNHSVQTIASNLLVQLQRGDTVVILCSPGLELVEILFACQRAGLLCIPLFPPDPSFSQENHYHLARVLSQTNPKAAIAEHQYILNVNEYVYSSSNNQHLSDRLKKLKWVSTKDIKKEFFSRSDSSSCSYEGVKPEEVYLIQYTSGATGIPKPVLVTAGSASHNVRVARKSYDLHPNSVIVSWLPQYHDCGLMFLLLTIVSGATCVLTSPGEFIERPRLWLEMITQYKATCTPVPSFTLPLVLRRGNEKGIISINLETLTNLIIINEPIYKARVVDFVTQFKEFGLNPSSISPSYGLAENCTYVSTSWRSDDDLLDIPSCNKLLPSARLGSGNKGNHELEIDIIVVNEDTDEIVEDGVEGEIWVASPSNASGYLGHPFLTRQVFQNRIKNTASKCFVLTGDRGIVKKWREERFLFVMGSSHDMLKLRNGKEVETIHPHYIETAAYNSFPNMLRGGCIACFNLSDKTIAIMAELQRNEGDSTDLERICEGIRESASKEINKNNEMGFLIVLVKSGNVPKTTSGKIQRWLAREKMTRGKMNAVMEMYFEGDSMKVVCENSETKRVGERKMPGSFLLSFL